MSEAFLAAFSGCLIALLTGTAILVTVYLPLARRRARVQLQGALEILATRGARSSGSSGSSGKPAPGSTAIATVGASAISETASAIAATADEWSDDWDDTESATQGSSAPIERATAWAVGIVPAGARSRIQIARTVFLGSDEEDEGESVRVGTPRRGTFRGSEIRVDGRCAESFAICDVLVCGVSQLWSEKARDGRRCVRRVGEIPAEAFAAEPYGALTMDAAGPHDDVEIVVRNVDDSDREFRATIRGEYRADGSR